MKRDELRQFDLWGKPHRLPKFQKGDRVWISDEEEDDYYGEAGKITGLRQLKRDIYEVTLDWGGRVVYFTEEQLEKEQ